MPEILKKLQKPGKQPFQIFKTTKRVFYFRLGIGKSVKSFQSKFIVPRYPKYSCLKGLLFCKEFLNYMESWIPLKFSEFTGNIYSQFLGTWALQTPSGNF